VCIVDSSINFFRNIVAYTIHCFCEKGKWQNAYELKILTWERPVQESLHFDAKDCFLEIAFREIFSYAKGSRNLNLFKEVKP
jgi:hypothetical protein